MKTGEIRWKFCDTHGFKGAFATSPCDCVYVFLLISVFRPVIGPWALGENISLELANQSARYIGNILSFIIILHSTCELNNLFAFWTFTSAPFKRLLDPGGKCKYISDMHSPISAARRQPQMKMFLMSCFKQKNQICVNWHTTQLLA